MTKFETLITFVERRKAELLDNETYRELSVRKMDDFDVYSKCLVMEEDAWRQAERESEATDIYREWLAEENRLENARASLLPRIETYENGHQTFYDMDGNVIGENLA